MEQKKYNYYKNLIDHLYKIIACNEAEFYYHKGLKNIDNIKQCIKCNNDISNIIYDLINDIVLSETLKNKNILLNDIKQLNKYNNISYKIIIKN